MYIVNIDEMLNKLKESESIIYSNISCCNIDGLYVATYSNDQEFQSRDLIDSVKLDVNVLNINVDRMKEDLNYRCESGNNTTFKGPYEGEREYLVYEYKDVEKLIKRLESIIK